jgi:hypothetical protein
MSRLSDNVKAWRRNNKLKIIEAMGGKCVCCGYHKSTFALSLHHIDPNEKDISFNRIRANPIAWKKIVVELRKCVLVCSNCHMEIHEGITNIPNDAPKFNEDYYTVKEKEDKCPVCQKNKSIYRLTCSRTCARKLSWKTNWENINLKKELETKSITQLADELNISDSAIHKRLKKYHS